MNIQQQYQKTAAAFNNTSHLQNEPFIFDPLNGPILNIDQNSLTNTNDNGPRFEVYHSIPLVAINKVKEYPERENFICNPNNPIIKNEIISGIFFSDNQAFIRKDAIELIASCLDKLCNNNDNHDNNVDYNNNKMNNEGYNESIPKINTNNNYMHALDFYISLLLTYPPENKPTTLLTYYETITQFIKRQSIHIEKKIFLILNGIKNTWENAKYAKYTNFETVFKKFKSFTKASLKVTNITGGSLQDSTVQGLYISYSTLVKKEITQKAYNILRTFLSNRSGELREDVRTIALVKIISWIDKLIDKKVILNFKIENIINEFKNVIDHHTIAILCQMFDKDTLDKSYIKAPKPQQENKNQYNNMDRNNQDPITIYNPYPTNINTAAQDDIRIHQNPQSSYPLTQQESQPMVSQLQQQQITACYTSSVAGNGIQIQMLNTNIPPVTSQRVSSGYNEGSMSHGQNQMQNAETLNKPKVHLVVDASDQVIKNAMPNEHDRQITTSMNSQSKPSVKDNTQILNSNIVLNQGKAETKPNVTQYTETMNKTATTEAQLKNFLREQKNFLELVDSTGAYEHKNHKIIVEFLKTAAEIKDISCIDLKQIENVIKRWQNNYKHNHLKNVFIAYMDFCEAHKITPDSEFVKFFEKKQLELSKDTQKPAIINETLLKDLSKKDAKVVIASNNSEINPFEMKIEQDLKIIKQISEHAIEKKTQEKNKENDKVKDQDKSKDQDKIKDQDKGKEKSKCKKQGSPYPPQYNFNDTKTLMGPFGKVKKPLEDNSNGNNAGGINEDIITEKKKDDQPKMNEVEELEQKLIADNKDYASNFNKVANKIYQDLNSILIVRFPFVKLIKIGSIGGGYITTRTNNINLALTCIDLSVDVNEDELINALMEFLYENRKSILDDLKIETRYNKKTIIFKHNVFNTICTLIIDLNCTYSQMLLKLKTLISFQPFIVKSMYSIQTEFDSYDLFKESNINNYMILIMLIVAAQMKFDDNKSYIIGLNDEFPHVEKIEKSELIKRFYLLYGSWIKNKTSKCLSPLVGKITELSNNFEDKLINIEDPFQLGYNIFHSGNFSTFDVIFQENLLVLKI